MNTHVHFQTIIKSILVTATSGWMIIVSSNLYALNSFGDGLDEQRDTVANMFSGTGGDPRAQGSTWSERNVFLVGIKKDLKNVNVNDYAEYVCNVVTDYGFRGHNVKVQLVDIDELNKTTGGWVYLAEANCK